jgi:hypothetical protein
MQLGKQRSVAWLKPESRPDEFVVRIEMGTVTRILNIALSDYASRVA